MANVLVADAMSLYEAVYGSQTQWADVLNVTTEAHALLP